jgi:hypothetical protein
MFDSRDSFRAFTAIFREILSRFFTFGERDFSRFYLLAVITFELCGKFGVFSFCSVEPVEVEMNKCERFLETFEGQRKFF